MKYLFLCLFVIISTINILAQNKKFPSIIKHITKPLIIPFLLLFYLESSNHENLLVLGLLFGWLGDVLIIFHHYLKNDQKYNIIPIVSGLAAFFVGHLCYILLFIDSKSMSLLIFVYLIIGLATIISLFNIGLLNSKNNTLKTHQKLILKIAIIIYTFTIMSMSYFSFQVNAIVFLGSLSFLLSDSVLSLKEFGQIKLPEQLVMITYITAQFLIVLGYL